MISNPHACHRMFRSRIPTKQTESLWISDDLLNEAFHRYVYFQRRCGSSVPGPLEARKRANKRRNANLAAASAHNPSVDVGLLLEPGKQQPWWSNNAGRSQRRVPDNANTSLPSWLANYNPEEYSQPSVATNPSWIDQSAQQLEVPTGELPQIEETVDDNKILHDSTSHLLPKEVFKARLGVAKKIEDVQTLLRGNPNIEYWDLALTHALVHQWPISDVQALLADQALNCPAQHGHSLILQHLSQFQDPRYMQLLGIVEGDIAMGLVEKEEIRTIFTQLPNVLLESIGQELTLGHTGLLNQHYHRLLNSVANSRTWCVEDLGTEVVYGILQHMKRVPFDDAAIGVVEQLLAKCPVAVPLVSNLLCAWLVSIGCGNIKIHRKRFTLTASAILQKLKPQTFVTLISATSENLVARVKDGQAERKDIALWEDILKALPVQDDFFQEPHWTERNAAQLENQLEAVEAAFVRIWTASLISTAHVRFRTSNVHHTLLQNLCEQFRHIMRPDEKLVESLVRTAKSLPIQSSRFLPVLIDVIVPNTALSPRPGQLSSQLSEILDDGLSALHNDTSYKSHMVFHRDTLVAVSERINADLPQFTHYAHGLVLRDKLSFRVLTRLLNNNLAFKNALSMSANPKRNGGMNSFPDQCLRTVNNLATAFACSPVISSTQAFRKVRWCYLFLHKHGAPIRPQLTRALFHAGLTRRSLPTIEPSRFDWVIGQVRQVEGPDVARKLACLGDPGYEQSALRQLSLDSKCSKISQGRVRDMATKPLVRKFLS